MPLKGKVRYGVTKSGVRLAFRGKGKIVEAKSLKTGKKHTEAEFEEDRKRKARAKAKTKKVKKSRK